MRPFQITGARVLLPDGMVQEPLVVAGPVIGPCDAGSDAGRVVDLTGWLVVPGIVDLHGDGFERHLAPRRGAVRDIAKGLWASEAELAANGITTAYLAQFWSWEGGMRSPDFALEMLAAHAALGPEPGTDMRVQLRFETHLLDDYQRFADAVTRFGVEYVVFNDHVPHAALARGKRVPRLTGQALKSGRSPEAHLALLQRLHDGSGAVPEAVAGLARQLAGRAGKAGRRLGSHDDATASARGFWRGIGAGIAEFPMTDAAITAARAAGDPVIMGAPNVLRGGSHSGGISARDVVLGGGCRALASDYHYPAPRLAALALARDIGLAAAWALVSSGPADVMGLADRGRLVPGARADFVVMSPEGRVGATFAGGQVRYMAGAVAAAFMDGAG